MSVHIEKLPGAAFLAFPEMKNLLTAELAGRFGYRKAVASATIDGTSYSPENHRVQWYGDLLYCSDWDKSEYPYWASTVMTEPFILHFDSNGEAASALKQIQRNWAPYQYQLFRRANFIQEKLPYINLKPRKFPAEIPDTPMGLYTLTDENTMIASAATTSPLPAGRLIWQEDHINPPSRAYLKIQESLTLAKLFFNAVLPHEGTVCFEAGACPGGWTWVLRKLESDVIAVDRAELADSLMKDPHVKFMKHDAFTLKPQEIGKTDWVFSDVICYPERLLEWIKVWLESGMTENMICTIKMQGEINWKLISEFASIPDSRILHLNYNKHELTWIHVQKQSQ